MRVVIIVAFLTRSRADVVCGGHTAVTCDLCPQGYGAASFSKPSEPMLPRTCRRH